MKELLLLFALACCHVNGLTQGKDEELIGEWHLFEIIDNLTGQTTPITHQSNDSIVYKINFSDIKVRFNKEINKCENEYLVKKDGSIEFKYFSSCSEFCCDGEFSELLTYDEATKYFIKEGRTLILISEDRIFYLRKLLE